MSMPLLAENTPAPVAAKGQAAARMRLSLLELSGFGSEKAIQVSTTDILQTSFNKTGFFQMTERKELAAILKEKGLDQAVAMQDSQAIDAGSAAGAEVVAVGKLTMFDGVYQLSVRILDVKTGKVEATATANAAANKLAVACNTVANELKERMAAVALLNAKQDKVVHLVDERGSVMNKKPSLVSLYLGNRFVLDTASAQDSAKSFASPVMLRPDEVIYKGSGATLNAADAGFVAEPTMRVEWEVPFQNWPFSTQLSLEGGFTTTRNLLTSSGNFRYQNAQANHVALTDVTYTGTLTASDKRYNLTPMLGFGLDYTNRVLAKAAELRILVRVAAGVSFQSGKRTYDLVLNPQSISAGSYTDTYVIKSSMTQSYAMAILPAGRVDLGFRFRLSSSLHLTVMGSCTVFYGVLPYDNYGYFTEQAGANKVTFQKITASTADESYFGISPAVFLALSSEL